MEFRPVLTLAATRFGIALSNIYNRISQEGGIGPPLCYHLTARWRGCSIVYIMSEQDTKDSVICVRDIPGVEERARDLARRLKLRRADLLRYALRLGLSDEAVLKRFLLNFRKD